MGSYIIVSKWSNIVLLRSSGKSCNPPSGTVVDDVVTLSERYDFYLVSQSVRQATVTPTSYNLVKDISGLRLDHIQSLTCMLTHIFSNYPGRLEACRWTAEKDGM